MFIIGEAIIDEPVAHERFACDLGSCKGACCTLPGGRGAPLEDEEVVELERAYPIVKEYLPELHRRAIELNGCVEGVPGSYATSCIDDNACVFVHYDEGVARCSIERAYQEGKIAWRKPLSCHLFPLRISGEKMPRVRYEKISECKGGRVHGRNANMPLSVFLKVALVRRFGEQWYEEFAAECIRRDGLPSAL